MSAAFFIFAFSTFFMIHLKDNGVFYGENERWWSVPIPLSPIAIFRERGDGGPYLYVVRHDKGDGGRN